MTECRLYPTAVHQDSPESIEWGPVQWADEDAFAGADYPEPDADTGERRFYTVAIRRGQVPDSTTGSVAILGVTRDLEVGYETRLPADVDDGTWTLADPNHEGIPAAVTERPPNESTIPEGRRTWYREVLERAHGLGVDGREKATAVESGEFRPATQLRADGGETVCGKRSCHDAGTVSYSERGAVRVRCERHALEAVDGIGPTSAERLIDEFGSLEEICYASRYRRTTIAQLRGFSPDSAGALEEKLKGAGIWQDPEDDPTTHDSFSERELVERAVREALDLVSAGDGADVAVGYVVEEYGIEHRRADILRRVLEHLEDDTDDDDDARPIAIADGGSPIYELEVDERAAFMAFDSLERATLHAAQADEMEVAAEYLDTLFLLQAQNDELLERYNAQCEELREEAAEEQGAIAAAIVEVKNWAHANGHDVAEWFEAERDERGAVTDGGRDVDSRGREAFLSGDAHWCDICSRPFDSFKELVNHDCRPKTEDGVPVHVRNGAGSTSVLGPDPHAFEATGGDER